MKQRSTLIALRLAQFIEEYSESEIRQAVKILESHGHVSSLLTYLAETKKPNDSKIHYNNLSKKQSIAKSFDTLSRALLNIQDVEPEKFRILSEFELKVRENKILSTHESLKRFGEHISKNFIPSKSKSDTIAIISTLLADLSISEIESQIEYASSFNGSRNTDHYQKLAKYLIEGSNTDNKSENE